MDEARAPERARGGGDREEFTFLDVLVVLAKQKKYVVLLPIAAALAALVWGLLTPNVYTATTKIMPPQQNQSTAVLMLSQLSSLAGGGGAGSALKSPGEIYVGMLKSRTVADNIIGRFGLNARYGQDHQSATRRILASSSQITIGKDGIITIDAEDADPKLAAALANAYTDELLKLTQVLAVTEASQRRLFFEQQVQQARDSLSKAEVAARQALERGGLVKVDDQGRAMVATSARLRGQIAAKEVQIGAMRTFAADNNAELKIALEEFDALKRELAKIEGASGLRAVGQAGGDKGMESLRLLRDVKYNETLFELLARQYEMAKIDEAKDSALVQVLDHAIVPDRKSKPKRLVIVIVATLVALFLGILLAFVHEAFSGMSSNPQQAERLQALKRYLAWR